MIGNKINVLVMAVGSPLGQSIYKALLQSTLPLKIHLADISEMAAGFYINKNTTNLILPPIKADTYFDELKRIVEKFNFNVIFPVIAAEHKFFADYMAYFETNNIKVVTPPQEIFDLCNDKYRSMIFLREKGINAPDTVQCDDESELELFLTRNQFPVWMKPRYGASSADVFLVRNIDQLIALKKAFPSHYFIIQTYLNSPDEYTIGVYISRDQHFKQTFIIKRELKFGLSYKGEVIEDQLISDYCLELCATLGIYYSTNVQIKVVEGQPYVFEINPRLSSTTAVRARFGFNEPELIIWELFNDLSTYQCTVKKGRFMRYWEEIYLDAP